MALEQGNMRITVLQTDIAWADVEANIMSSMENVNLDNVISFTKDGVSHCFMDEY